MSATSPPALPLLRGHRILVVEDEYMIAEEVATALGKAGAEVLGPVPSVVKALRLIAPGSRIDGGLLDVNLRGEAVWPAVDALLARGVPVLLATGYDVGAIPKAYIHLPRLEKPATGQEVARALARVLAASAPERAKAENSA